MFRNVQESQTLLINTLSQNLAAENKEIIKFGFGQSPFLPPKAVMEGLANAVHHKEYASVQGDPELRARMARFHEAHNGLRVAPDNILIAPGSKILLFNILLAFINADVFIPAPAWVSYAPQAELAGHHIIKLETSFAERWRISAQTLHQAAQHKKHKASILILNYPGNPDGLTYTQTELQDIARAAKALDILVIADEIYGLLSHDHPHLSFAQYYPEKTITTTGLSKWCGAGGWRFGAALLYDNIEPAFKKALLGIGSETYSCAPSPVQMAAKVAYQDYEKMTEYLDYQNQILRQVGTYCAEGLHAAGINVHPPQGGFYLFPDFSPYQEKLHSRGINTSNKLCERLLQESGVALLPASAFGFPEDYLAARLAFVDFEEPGQDKPFDLPKHGPRIITGIEQISTWINPQ